MKEKSEVEKFFEAVAAKFGVQKKYHELHPVQQMPVFALQNFSCRSSPDVSD